MVQNNDIKQLSGGHHKQIKQKQQQKQHNVNFLSL